MAWPLVFSVGNLFFISLALVQCMLIGRLLTDGRMSARLKYDLTDNLSVKVNAQVFNELFCMFVVCPSVE